MKQYIFERLERRVIWAGNEEEAKADLLAFTNEEDGDVWELVNVRDA